MLKAKGHYKTRNKKSVGLFKRALPLNAHVPKMYSIRTAEQNLTFKEGNQ